MNIKDGLINESFDFILNNDYDINVIEKDEIKIIVLKKYNDEITLETRNSYLYKNKYTSLIIDLNKIDNEELIKKAKEVRQKINNIFKNY